MSDAQKLIADVASKHRLKYDDWAVRDTDFYTCACGLKTPLGDGAHAEWWDAHLASEIDKALGGLTLEWLAVAFDARGHGYLVHRTAKNVDQLSSRWVSGWSEVQP
ncbi:hypothetical protein [Mycolicibacterium peregrinum]|uniref:hypothetical protein n=1 Tax=Mycolicibacterium peregrinum TaxID=43304 RepID=UPI003AAD6B50